MTTKTRMPASRGVRRRVFQVLEEHPEFWREGKLETRDLGISLPSAVWTFIDNFARKTKQTSAETIAMFAQEYLGIVLMTAQKEILVRQS